MNSASGANNNIEKLNDHNYETWKLHMRSVLVYNDLWDVTIQKEAKSSDTEWDKKSGKALALILLGLRENQLGYVKKAKTAYEAWKSLENVHRSKGPTKKVMLYRQLFQLRKRPEVSMADHLRDFQSKVDHLEEAGISIPKELLSIMMLNSLSDEYERFCVAMEARDDLPDVNSLVSKLIDEEARKAASVDVTTNEQSALLSDERARSNKKKEFRRDKQYQTKPTQSHRFDGCCFNCGRRGHRATECRAKRKPRRDRTEVKEEVMTMLAADGDQCAKSKWFLDSGASTHMCNDSSLFVEWDYKQQELKHLFHLEVELYS